MKILIDVDMEGISGVVIWDQVDPGHAEYARFRQIMTDDVNAAIKGASSAAQADFLVTDGHWHGTNILIEKLDPRASLNCGPDPEFSMVQGADSGVDAAFFIGYHARAGSLKANLDHTWSSSRISNVWLNGRLVGEFGLNAAVCGHFGVPALLISGDQTVCAEAQEWVPGIETAQVKTASGRYSAECLPLAESQKRIREAAERAVRGYVAGNHPPALTIEKPVKIKVEFQMTHIADAVSIMPGIKRLDGRTLEIKAADMVEAFKAFRTMVSLS